MAGGVKPGLRLGATDDFGLVAVESPVRFRDLRISILASMGLNNVCVPLK
jgi:hypothetical protein